MPRHTVSEVDEAIGANRPRISDRRLDDVVGKLWERELALCAESPEYYIFNYVRTNDPHDRLNPIKLFPDHEYLRYIVREWHERREIDPVSFVVKSRQLSLSWLAVAYVSWLCRFHSHQLALFRSKKEKDAADMIFHATESVARLSVIESHLPLWMRQNLSYAYGQAFYPNGSVVEALPQGAEGVESRVPSLVIDDECSLQDQWKGGYAAALPCTDRGGQYIGISTVRMPSDFSEEVREGFELKELVMKGVWRYKSLSNIPTIAVHYSADNSKDPSTEIGLEWFESLSQKWPGGPEGVLWRQHMEMDFEAMGGTKLLPFLPKYEHTTLTCDPIPKSRQVGWWYSAGFDYGKRNPCALVVYGHDPHGTKFQVDEIYGPGEELGGVRGVSKLIKANPYYDDFKNRMPADPSMWNDNQSKEDGTYTSIAQLFADQGVHFQPSATKGQHADDVAIDRLRHWYWEDPEHPRLIIFKTCVNTLREWKGLRFMEWSDAVQADHNKRETLVDRNNNTWDAFKYEESRLPTPGSMKAPPRPGTAQYMFDLVVSENAAATSMHRIRPH